MNLWREIRYAIRRLGQAPGFALMAVFTLALGVGANSAIFSVVNGILFRPLPVHDPRSVVVLAFEKGKDQQNVVVFSYPDLQDIRQQTGQTFDDLFAYTAGLDGLDVNGRAERVLTVYATGDYFSSLGLQPALGRLLLPTEGKVPGADPVIVLGYDYWRTRFAADPTVIGRRVDLDGRPVTIVGVAPRDFHGTFALANAQVYMPLAMAMVNEPSLFVPTFLTDRNQRGLFVMGRLKPGVSLPQAQDALNVIGRRLAQAYPEADRDMAIHAYIEQNARPGPDPKHQFQNLSTLFLVLAATVLALAAMNVANLQMVRATGSVPELAVRSALGARRGRLMAPLLVESVLLGLAGGLAGLAAGRGASYALSHLNLQTSLPVNLDFGVDWRVFLYALATAVAAGLLVGLMPALRVSRVNLATLLQGAGRGLGGGRQLVRSMLVAIQVGGSLALLIIAGLFVRSLRASETANLGFDPHNVMNFSIDPDLVGFDNSKGLAFYRALLQRVQAEPGIEAASLSFGVPEGLFNNQDTVHPEGWAIPPGQGAPVITFNIATPGIASVLRLHLLQGRFFNDADRKGTQPVAVVNQTMARKYWPSGALGHTFTMSADATHANWKIVGIVADGKLANLNDTPAPFFYVPLDQDYVSIVTLQVRTAGPPSSAVRPVERIVADLAPGMPLTDVQTQVTAMNGLNGYLIFEIGAWLAGTLGLIGLVLAVVGVFGVISYTTAQRTHEIGLRMALGARPGDIFGLIVIKGSVIVVVGLLLGLVAAYAVGRAASDFLVGVSGHDPITFIVGAALLSAAAAVACFLPARRAVHVDPNAALRHI